MPLYSDISWRLQKDYRLNDIKLVRDIDAVAQSIYSVIATAVGERVMNPEFGSRVRWLLFEPLDQITADQIKLEVMGAIERWEPRAIITNVVCVPKVDDNLYLVTIEFMVRGIENGVVNSMDINLPRG